MTSLQPPTTSLHYDIHPTTSSMEIACSWHPVALLDMGWEATKQGAVLKSLNPWRHSPSQCIYINLESSPGILPNSCIEINHNFFEILKP